MTRAILGMVLLIQQKNEEDNQINGECPYLLYTLDKVKCVGLTPYAPLDFF
jgi:hypothetical protein